MVKLCILLATLMLVLPMVVSADPENSLLQIGFAVSDECVWQELLNNPDTYRLTDPLCAVPYVQSPAFDQIEMGMETDVMVVACVPSQIPEPTTVILLGVGLLGLGIGSRRRR